MQQWGKAPSALAVLNVRRTSPPHWCSLIDLPAFTARGRGTILACGPKLVSSAPSVPTSVSDRCLTGNSWYLVEPKPVAE